LISRSVTRHMAFSCIATLGINTTTKRSMQTASASLAFNINATGLDVMGRVSPEKRSDEPWRKWRMEIVTKPQVVILCDMVRLRDSYSQLQVFRSGLRIGC